MIYEQLKTLFVELFERLRGWVKVGRVLAALI